jgi:hypothetical protein
MNLQGGGVRDMAHLDRVPQESAPSSQGDLGINAVILKSTNIRHTKDYKKYRYYKKSQLSQIVSKVGLFFCD